MRLGGNAEVLGVWRTRGLKNPERSNPPDEGGVPRAPLRWVRSALGGPANVVGVDGSETGCTRLRAGGSRGDGGIVGGGKVVVAPVVDVIEEVDRAVSIFKGGGGDAREPLVDADRVLSASEGGATTFWNVMGAVAFGWSSLRCGSAIEGFCGGRVKAFDGVNEGAFALRLPLGNWNAFPLKVGVDEKAGVGFG